PDALLRLVAEDQDLLALAVIHDRARHARALEGVGADLDVVAIACEHDGVKGDIAADFMVVKVGGDNVALGYAELLSARFDDRVHNHETLSGRPHPVNEIRGSPP